MSRTLNLRGTFTEGESRNLNGRILRKSTNPNPPPRVVTSNDFDRYINILKANNRFPIPKELTLPVYTTPYTLDKDLYLAKDSVINFLGTAPLYLNKFSLTTNNSSVYNISDKFTYTSVTKTINIPNSPKDYTIVYIQHHGSWYRVTYIVHRVASELSITIPNDSYYYDTPGQYDDVNDFPSIIFYEGDNYQLKLTAPSTSTVDGNAQITTSSLITQFVFT